MFEKLVVVTRKTRLQELTERMGTRGQVRFALSRSGVDLADLEREDTVYRRALDALARALDVGLQVQWLDRALVPTYLFSAQDAVVTVGQDGLVANTAKYVGAQPVLAVNPDPERFDGVLLPFSVDAVGAGLRSLLAGRARVRPVTLAEAVLSDGQRLLAFNDLFVGMSSHASARYTLSYRDRQEPHSSSGVLVSTGAGSTGWLSSVLNMASGLGALGGSAAVPALRLPWEDPRLVFVVREPFVSRHSRASVVAGFLEPGEELVLQSQVPSGGVVFSDGMEADRLNFNAGTTARLRAAPQAAQLVVG